MVHESEVEPIVTEILSGRAEKYAEIVRLYSKPLYNFVLNRVREPALASAITRDTFVRAFNSIIELGGARGPFRLSLYRMALKACLEHFRSGLRRSAGEPQHQATPAARQRTRARLFEWLRSIPGADAEILIMRFVDGLRDPEIAMITGLEADTVRARVHSGLRRLAAELETREKEADSRGV